MADRTSDEWKSTKLADLMRRYAGIFRRSLLTANFGREVNQDVQELAEEEDEEAEEVVDDDDARGLPIPLAPVDAVVAGGNAGTLGGAAADAVAGVDFDSEKMLPTDI
jgi:hypothetical protein